MLKKYFSFLIINLLIALSLPTFAQTVDSLQNDSIIVEPVIMSQQEWVDSVFASLSLKEKIGQLFMIRAHSNKNRAYHEMVPMKFEIIK